MAGLRGNSTFRGYVPEEQRLISVLEADSPLPDDDPKTRGGGLDPSQKEDLGQISMYAQLRQQGSISDKAWRRLIQRNPKTATLFSSIQTDPTVSTARARQEIGSKYFNPGQEAVPFETTEEQEFGLPALTGNLAKEAVAPKADVQGAILEALNKGDVEFATKLGYGNESSSGDIYEGPVLFDTKNNVYRATKDGRIVPIKVEGGAKIAPPVYTYDAIDPETGHTVRRVITKPQAASGAVPGGNLGSVGPSVYDKDTQKISDDVSASGLIDMDNAFLVLDKGIQTYGENLPGVGLAKNLPSADWFLTPQGKEIRSAVDTILNTKLKTASGAAVTVPEQIRKRLELSLSASRTAGDFISVYNSTLLPWYENTRKNLVGGYNPKAVEIYEGRSGIPLRESPIRKQRAEMMRSNGAIGSSPTKSSPERPTTLSETERARLEELRKKQSAR